MRQRRAFTLIELLVVVAIVTILLSLVVPALAAGRQSANRVACMSNLRQLATAFIAYAMDNHEHLPRCAPQGDLTGDCRPLPQDWVHWNWGRDIRQSAIAPYIRGFKTDLLVCPSDDPDLRLRDLGKWETEGKYRYSYSMNIYMGDLLQLDLCAENRLSRVKSPTEKIMLVEEDQSSIDDGCWHPVMMMTMNFLSIRHDRSRRSADFDPDADSPKLMFPQMRGNAAFADGHVEYITRAFAHDERNYLPRPALQ
jgi:prepilin-type N-terminal cleavage/methylation domain-containing protein/prepilin-type processing-associated H-X9-DG protein